MKCPYPQCQKDYNDESWPKVFEGFINPRGFGGSINEEENHNRLYIISRQCRFCHQYFHEVYIAQEKDDKIQSEFLVSYPCSKTKFEATGIPKNIRDYFNEAERCRSIGSITGTGACLRKSVYALCDDKNATGSDYREKIENLPIKESYKELLKQIKWLGDNTTKPGEEKYTKKMVDEALGILPFIIDELYLKDDQVDKATKLLAKVRSAKSLK
jgi:hypothetical protein